MVAGPKVVRSATETGERDGKRQRECTKAQSQITILKRKGSVLSVAYTGTMRHWLRGRVFIYRGRSSDMGSDIGSDIGLDILRIILGTAVKLGGSC